MSHAARSVAAWFVAHLDNARSKLAPGWFRRVALRNSGTVQQFYIATTGSDATGNGTIGLPWLTLGKAQTEVATWLAANPTHGDVFVNLRQGTYYLAAKHTWVVGDSGKSGAPVTWRSYPSESAVISGGVEVTGWAALADTDPNWARWSVAQKAAVKVIDLDAAGISDFGTLVKRGMESGGTNVYGRTESALELFCDGEPMELASYPNKGTWLPIKSGAAKSFTYDDTTPEGWAVDADIWAHGFFRWAWADTYEPVASINTGTKTVTITDPQCDYGYYTTGKFRFVNVLEAISAGEFYCDRTNKLLYAWFAGATPTTSVVSIVDDLLLCNATNYFRVADLTVECARGAGLEADAGTDVTFDNVTVRNIGSVGVVLYRGTNHKLVNSTVTQCGDGGVLLEQGDPSTLTDGGGLVYNNEISKWGRVVMLNFPAIRTFGNRAAGNHHGCGGVISRNYLHDAPGQAVWLYGNNHIVEYNDIFNVCQQGGDTGAIYMGKDQTQRGIIVRWNYIHVCVSVWGADQLQAVYIDDCLCGVQVYGNIIEGTDRGVLIGGGRDNIVENNLFRNVAGSWITHVDARGLDWRSTFFDGTPPSDTTMYAKVTLYDVNNPPYSDAYPKLTQYWADSPGTPKGCKLICNNYYGCIGAFTHFEYWDGALVEQTNNSSADPKIANSFLPSTPEDYDLADDSPMWALGWVRIPTELIGLED